MQIDSEQQPKEDAAEEEETERYGSKIIVIHPGSQNLRIGFASDALPKSVPNVIAKRAEKAEFEVEERWPKRVRVEEGQGGVDEDEPECGPVENDAEVSSAVNLHWVELMGNSSMKNARL